MPSRKHATAASLPPAGSVKGWICLRVCIRSSCVPLEGVDSLMAPRAERRERAWGRLATHLDPTKLKGLIEEVSLQAAIPRAPALLYGRVRGRMVLRTVDQPS